MCVYIDWNYFAAHLELTQHDKTTTIKNKSWEEFLLWCKGSVASLEHWDTGRTPGLAQWVKNLALLQLGPRSDPWPGNSTCHEVAKKEKKKKVMGKNFILFPC